MSDSKFLKHVGCPECGSSDSGALYTDGHVFCFGQCRKIVSVCGDSLDCSDDHDERSCSPAKKYVKYDRPMNITYKAIPDRGITRETCEKYGVWQDKDMRFYPYHNKDGAQVGQKVRNVPVKEFHTEGNFKDGLMFGQQLFHSGGKYVTVFEGEEDALAGFQMTGSQWSCVSVKTGAKGALKDCKDNYAWLDSFEAIVFCFDADAPGQEAAKECANLFGSKAKIVRLKDGKDASEYLQKGMTKQYVDAWWKAEEYRPDGIVTVADIKDRLLEPPTPGVPWCFNELTKLTYGRRPGELYAFGAGVGVGKTDVFTQSIAFDLTELKLPVGVIYLEQSVKETVQRVAGKIHQKRFHKPDDASWTREEYLAAIEDLTKRNQLFMVEHFGAMDWETIKGKIRYLSKAYDIKHIYLDHLTALSANESDERRALDGIMADMASLAQADGLILHFVSHLTTAEGKPHEEGGRVMEKHFTGSRAIARWSHFMFGLERNKQDEDPIRQQTTTFRVLKDRYLGDATAATFGLRYSKDTGMLSECSLETAMEAL